MCTWTQVLYYSTIFWYLYLTSGFVLRYFLLLLPYIYIYDILHAKHMTAL